MKRIILIINILFFFLGKDFNILKFFNIKYYHNIIPFLYKKDILFLEKCLLSLKIISLLNKSNIDIHYIKKVKQIRIIEVTKKIKHYNVYNESFETKDVFLYTINHYNQHYDIFSFFKLLNTINILDLFYIKIQLNRTINYLKLYDYFSKRKDN
jgi:hypothetical protein